MLEQLVTAYLKDLHSDDLAECFWETFDKHSALTELEAEELIQINEVIEEIKDAKILSKDALSQISEYHKALKKEIKKCEEDYF